MNANLLVDGRHSFGSHYYWSSFEEDANTAILVAFQAGVKILRSKDTLSFMCIPARAF
ncbi:MAG: hypothetical protein KAQ93_08565 [Spirochaetales bacterium]|nr:hypothetical protein [Spirochaetales bacterium]